MARFIVMVISTLFGFLLICGVSKSTNYNDIINSLPDSVFKSTFGVGYSILNFEFLGFKKKLLPSMRKKTSLIYGDKYADYYAYISVAKALTYTIILMTILPVIGVVISDTGSIFMLVVSIFASVVAWYFCVISISDETKKRQEICLAEFPDIVTKFALLINSGMVLHEAWRTVAYSKSNVLYDLMKNSCEEMENGSSEIDSIYEFGIKTNCMEIRKFTASMIQGVSKGNSELSIFLTEQAQEMLEHKRQTLLQKGEKAAGKLLIPIGITFVGIILIIGVGAMQSMSF